MLVTHDATRTACNLFKTCPGPQSVGSLGQMDNFNPPTADELAAAAVPKQKLGFGGVWGVAAASTGHHGGPHHHYQASQVGGGDGEDRGHGHVTGPGGSHCVAGAFVLEDEPLQVGASKAPGYCGTDVSSPISSKASSNSKTRVAVASRTSSKPIAVGSPAERASQSSTHRPDPRNWTARR
ncbi:uncharacterized protein LOC119768696 isoform X2 [Culex quinquefasciatus]|uniref:uncharacterized protein LOC119768696 isoform X2 n=1 Tax=Culex quinquefasciatus TaxID=7176 RepID=UPI0018E36F54|nr:uncharacterized protein LOC119768696 isoform X2 [Culex quinquefasciatus]